MKRKVKATTDNSGWTEPKIVIKRKKKRKPLTPEQKIAAAERLEKAREARAAKNPDYGVTNIHPSLRDLPDDHPLHPKKVKQWIKTQKEIVTSERAAERQNVKGAKAKRCSAEAYIRDMKTYLRNGDWISYFYGEYEQYKMGLKCVAMAYDADGNPKREVGVLYQDIGVYTQEMYNEDNGLDLVNDRKNKRRKRNKRALGK